MCHRRLVVSVFYTLSCTCSVLGVRAVVIGCVIILSFSMMCALSGREWVMSIPFCFVCPYLSSDLIDPFLWYDVVRMCG